MAPVVLRIRAPADVVWRVVGERWADVHRIIPSLAASRLLTDGALGAGAARECTLAKPVMGMKSVEERLTHWEPGRSFTYVFDAPPWPLHSIANTWTIQPRGDETELTLTPALRMRGGAWTQWLAPPMLAALSRSLEGDIPAMAAAIERECAALRAVPGAGFEPANP